MTNSQAVLRVLFLLLCSFNPKQYFV